jgi:hypothetical protein
MQASAEKAFTAFRSAEAAIAPTEPHLPKIRGNFGKLCNYTGLQLENSDFTQNRIFHTQTTSTELCRAQSFMGFLGFLA